MRVSWSLLRLYEQCPLAARLIRIEKVEREKALQKRYVTGTTGHRFFALWFRRGFDKRTKPEEAAWIFDRAIKKERILWENNDERFRARNRVIREAMMLMEAVRSSKIDSIGALRIERRLSAPFPFGNHSIEGIADMISEEDLWLSEMKMSDDPKWSDPAQLIFYGLIFKMTKGIPPTRLSFFLPTNKTRDKLIDIEFSEDDFIWMYNRVENLIMKWGKGIFPASARRETCRWCEVQTYCKNGEMALTNSPMLPGI